MEVKELITKNICFRVDDLGQLPDFIKSIANEIYVHLSNDFKGCPAGAYQVCWSIGELNTGESDAIESGQVEENNQLQHIGDGESGISAEASCGRQFN